MMLSFVMLQEIINYNFYIIKFDEIFL